MDDPTCLPAPARQAIEESLAAGDAVLVSSISAWEVAQLVARGATLVTADARLRAHGALTTLWD